MAKKSKAKEHSWIVRMKVTYNQYVYVKAFNADEAEDKANAGDWEGEETSTMEIVDFSLRGKPELNE